MEIVALVLIFLIVVGMIADDYFRNKKCTEITFKLTVASNSIAFIARNYNLNNIGGNVVAIGKNCKIKIGDYVVCNKDNCYNIIYTNEDPIVILEESKILVSTSKEQLDEMVKNEHNNR